MVDIIYCHVLFSYLDFAVAWWILSTVTCYLVLSTSLQHGGYYLLSRVIQFSRLRCSMVDIIYCHVLFSYLDFAVAWLILSTVTCYLVLSTSLQHGGYYLLSRVIQLSRLRCSMVDIIYCHVLFSSLDFAVAWWILSTVTCYLVLSTSLQHGGYYLLSRVIQLSRLRCSMVDIIYCHVLFSSLDFAVAWWILSTVTCYLVLSTSLQHGGYYLLSRVIQFSRLRCSMVDIIYCHVLFSYLDFAVAWWILSTVTCYLVISTSPQHGGYYLLSRVIQLSRLRCSMVDIIYCHVLFSYLDFAVTWWRLSTVTCYLVLSTSLQHGGYYLLSRVIQLSPLRCSMVDIIYCHVLFSYLDFAVAWWILSTVTCYLVISTSLQHGGYYLLSRVIQLSRLRCSMVDIIYCHVLFSYLDFAVAWWILSTVTCYLVISTSLQHGGYYLLSRVIQLSRLRCSMVDIIYCHVLFSSLDFAVAWWILSTVTCYLVLSTSLQHGGYYLLSRVIQFSRIRCSMADIIYCHVLFSYIDFAVAWLILSTVTCYLVISTSLQHGGYYLLSRVIQLSRLRCSMVDIIYCHVLFSSLDFAVAWWILSTVTCYLVLSTSLQHGGYYLLSRVIQLSRLRCSMVDIIYCHVLFSSLDFAVAWWILSTVTCYLVISTSLQHGGYYLLSCVIQFSRLRCSMVDIIYCHVLFSSLDFAVAWWILSIVTCYLVISTSLQHGGYYLLSRVIQFSRLRCSMVDIIYCHVLFSSLDFAVAWWILSTVTCYLVLSTSLQHGGYYLLSRVIQLSRLRCSMVDIIYCHVLFSYLDFAVAWRILSTVTCYLVISTSLQHGGYYLLSRVIQLSRLRCNMVEIIYCHVLFSSLDFAVAWWILSTVTCYLVISTSLQHGGYYLLSRVIQLSRLRCSMVDIIYCHVLFSYLDFAVAWWILSTVTCYLVISTSLQHGGYYLLSRVIQLSRLRCSMVDIIYCHVLFSSLDFAVAWWILSTVTCYLVLSTSLQHGGYYLLSRVIQFFSRIRCSMADIIYCHVLFSYIDFAVAWLILSTVTCYLVISTSLQHGGYYLLSRVIQLSRLRCSMVDIIYCHVLFSSLDFAVAWWILSTVTCYLVISTSLQHG